MVECLGSTQARYRHTTVAETASGPPDAPGAHSAVLTWSCAYVKRSATGRRALTPRCGATTLRAGLLDRRAPASGRLLPRAAGLARRRLAGRGLLSGRRPCGPSSCGPSFLGRRLLRRRSCEPSSCELWPSCAPPACEPSSCGPWPSSRAAGLASPTSCGPVVFFRAPVVLRAEVFRAVARPPFAPAFLTEGRPASGRLLRAPPSCEPVVLRAAVLRVDWSCWPSSCEPSWSCDCSSCARPSCGSSHPTCFEKSRSGSGSSTAAEERVVAGTATAVLPQPLAIDASPMAESLHVSSAVFGAVRRLAHESALDVSASPVPLQSSWVINDLLSRIARARFPTTLLCNVQRGRHTSFARCWKGKHNVGLHETTRSARRYLLDLSCGDVARRRRARTLNDVSGASAEQRSARRRRRAARSSSVTITCAPRGTRTLSFVVPPSNVPAGRTAGSADPRLVGVAVRRRRQGDVETALPEGATTSSPAAPRTGICRASGSREHLGRGALARQRVMEGRRPDPEAQPRPRGRTATTAATETASDAVARSGTTFCSPLGPPRGCARAARGGGRRSRERTRAPAASSEGLRARAGSARSPRGAPRDARARRGPARRARRARKARGVSLVRHPIRFARGFSPVQSRPLRALLERLVLDVVLGGVLVDEPVDDLHALAVRVVDADERLPLLGQRVLGEDRLDRALRLAGAAVDALLGVDHEDPSPRGCSRRGRRRCRSGP